jgi:hypothetical protein
MCDRDMKRKMTLVAKDVGNIPGRVPTVEKLCGHFLCVKTVGRTSDENSFHCSEHIIIRKCAMEGFTYIVSWFFQTRIIASFVLKSNNAISKVAPDIAPN